MKILKIATFLSVAYIIFAWFTFTTMDTGSGAAEQIGSAIGMIMILPHLMLASIGMIFNLIGVKNIKSGFILTSAILYTISVVIMPFWAFLLIPGMILMWIGYAKMPKK